ncbi:MAG: hemerythrin domain-containing protein [Gammaproteobacteria bacterium]|nr:hemerythrin domain-containing protein [Gammaproteobacteria bacterium]
MKNILNKLHNDHINFSKLLAFLEKQYHLLEDCERLELSSVLDAIKYMKEYPDYVHHPLENAVFKYYLDHYEGAHEKITELLHEHEEMPLLTIKLIDMLQGALADVPQSRAELCTYLDEYISIQKEHMNEEEVHVYPILSSKLDENDWKKIDHELAHVEDPLFGEKVEKSYQGLIQQIVG